jgi:fatty-acid peroxygenase
VHTLDNAEHRHRKEAFLRVLAGPGLPSLAQAVQQEWEQAAEGWHAREEIVLFDEAAAVLLAGVWRWAGLSTTRLDVAATARDLVAMVDGFGTVGARHWRARRARARQEALLTGHVANEAAPGTALAAMTALTGLDGELVTPRVAAVELLNIIRPTVAVAWFVAFGAHALHLFPEHREPLAGGDPGYVRDFVHEVRRFYPFAPFVGATAQQDVELGGERIERGQMVLFDIYGQNHHPDLWSDPYAFRPARFTDVRIDPDTLVPQGGGPESGHRCPGEGAVVLLLEVLLPRLAALPYGVPPQDMSISLSRVPAKPRSGMRIRIR